MPEWKHLRILTGIFILIGVWYEDCLPDDLFIHPTSTVIEDREGMLLGARIADDGQWRFPERTSVPEKFKQAILQFEDREFYDHNGFNPNSMVRAMRQNLSSGRVVSGGSTLTMQTIRLMRKNPSRTFAEKAVEIVMATRLEFHSSKDQILAYYASYAPFGGNVVGIDAASWRYFGCSPERLSWGESATLAVLPNAPGLIFPGKNHDLLLDKRNRLLDRLHEIELISETDLQLAKAEPLPGRPHPLPTHAPHLLDRLIAEGFKGKRVRTTLDINVQLHANRMVELHHRELAVNGINNAAAIVVDVETGAVTAYVGNTNSMDAEHGGFVDIIKAPRSTGSILKPFLYASMLEDGFLTPDMLVADIPAHISGYVPKNYYPTYDGAVPAGNALSRSLNVPAVLMLRRYGVGRFHRQLKKMGMTTLNHPSGHYGLSLILGGAEANLWDLSSMYSNMGRTLVDFAAGEEAREIEPWYILAINGEETPEAKSGKATLSPGAVWSTFEALRKVSRPEGEAGWEHFEAPGQIAWKTGTSFGFRDAWAVGTSRNHVVAVWAGNADGEGRPGLVGVKAAAPLLFDIFDPLPTTDWYRQPWDDMHEISICSRSGHRASEICKEVEQQAVPKTSLATLSCPYHQLVHLDASASYRVDASCQHVDEMIHESWFVLPPAMEWYYKSHHPEYRILPEVRSDCAIASEERTPITIIYPKNESRIYVPIELDGTMGKTVFEAAHSDRSASLFWHLDEEYLGSTKNIHQLELRPEEGEHVLTIVDAAGHRLSQEFTIVGTADENDEVVDSP